MSSLLTQLVFTVPLASSNFMLICLPFDAPRAPLFASMDHPAITALSNPYYSLSCMIFPQQFQGTCDCCVSIQFSPLFCPLSIISRLFMKKFGPQALCSVLNSRWLVSQLPLTGGTLILLRIKHALMDYPQAYASPLKVGAIG